MATAVLSAAAQSVLEAIERAFVAGTTFDTEINSEAIRRVSYNPVSGRLTVTFSGNDTGYIFFDVPTTTVARFLASSSKGRFYHTKLKGQFDS